MEIRKFEQKGNEVSMTLSVRGTQNTFTGKLAPEGESAGQVLGIMRFFGRVYPARLEKTEAEKVAGAAGPPPGIQELTAAREAPAGKARIQKLQAALGSLKGPAKSMAYQLILESAAAAELTEAQVREKLAEWVGIAKPYGEELADEYRSSAMRALQGKKPYAGLCLELALDGEKKLPEKALRPIKLAAFQSIASAAKLAGKADLSAKYATMCLELAQEAEKELPGTATLAQQSAAMKSVLNFAKLAGKADLAGEYAPRIEKIEHQLDEEYHAKVPPYKPEAFAGRENKAHDRVVLLELFTGAQCPPCVAADVAFDGLLSTYKPTELVTLQYHLHIPGPDPLTNADSESRSKFYAVRGTPSLYFNGKFAGEFDPQLAGGGGMAGAEAKYGQYRKVIEGQLAANKDAKIDLRLTRSGDRIIVSGAATAKGEEGAKLRVRLAITEEVVKYVGSNQLRFHHHVVRGLPGGVEGKEIVAGECVLNQTIDLAEMRQTLADYVEGKTFANDPPAVGNELSLVAFIQNDADKSVLHAVVVPLPAK